MGTGASRSRLTPSEAQRLAEQDTVVAAAGRADALDLLDGAEELIAEIDDLLVERPFLFCFIQWDGE